MAANEQFDWRQDDRRVYALAAIMFLMVVFIGFARTYYLKFAFETPPISRVLVHVHGLLMTVWVGYFISQVWLIRSKNARMHMKAGVIGVVLAAAIIVVGFMTAVAAVKFGPAAAPTPGDIPALSFVAIPLFDLAMFAILFGGAIYYRKRPADHKRLMLLTVINFLPPAIARMQLGPVSAMGPLFFFGVPTILTIGFIAYDTWRNGKLNKVFLTGGILLIISYPLRLIMSSTEPWMAFAAWLTSWAA